MAESGVVDALSMSKSSHFSSGAIWARKAAKTCRMYSGRGLYEQITTEIKSLNRISTLLCSQVIRRCRLSLTSGEHS